MTEVKHAAAKMPKKQLLFLLMLICLLLLLVFSSPVAEAVRRALALCYQTIIPSLFPFMILSELLIAAQEKKKKERVRLDRMCKAIWGIPLIGMRAFLLGALCGFPIGVKHVADLYRAGELTRAEAEQALAFVDNTGPAFVIAGIGSLLGNRHIGLALYLLQLLCALASGALLARLAPAKPDNTRYHAENNAVVFDIAAAVRRSVGNMLTVCGMIVAFSIPLVFLNQMTKNTVLLSFFSSFFEIGNASLLAANLFPAAPRAALLALANAVCFGGLSVHLQAAVFVADLPLSLRRHTAGKLVQAALASFAMLLCTLGF